ncbi:MAG: NUDIX domain-containing protein [Ramlibacter sp.]|nr:NUDIX domain-containing protein [Ramlibacter sp.]
MPLLAGTDPIGSVEPGFLEKISLKPSPDGHYALQKHEHEGQPGWRITGDLSAGLAAVALALREAGLAGAWRNELLAVTDAQGRVLGAVERAAVRPLGIPTRAVHLVGRSPDGGHWVQRRALDKANDPGLWDTLMGGMVAAADTLHGALERETFEEAGLALPSLQHLRHGGVVRMTAPARDGLGAGYVVEHLDWFECTVPAGLVPANQDGEVEEFRCLTPAEVRERLHRGEFTLEAGLILCAAGL